MIYTNIKKNEFIKNLNNVNLLEFAARCNKEIIFKHLVNVGEIMDDNIHYAVFRYMNEKFIITYMNYYNPNIVDFNPTIIASLRHHHDLMDVLLQKGYSKSSGFIDSECYVCLESLGNGWIIPECGHLLHKKCQEKWNRPCGVCRKDIDLSKCVFSMSYIIHNHSRR